MWSLPSSRIIFSVQTLALFILSSQNHIKNYRNESHKKDWQYIMFASGYLGLCIFTFECWKCYPLMSLCYSKLTISSNFIFSIHILARKSIFQNTLLHSFYCFFAVNYPVLPYINMHSMYIFAFHTWSYFNFKRYYIFWHWSFQAVSLELPHFNDTFQCWCKHLLEVLM